MALMAHYSGTCPECGERWQPGDFIRSPESPPPGMPAQWQHASCPVGAASDFEHHAPVCEKCWLSHPEGACDR